MGEMENFASWSLKANLRMEPQGATNELASQLAARWEDNNEALQPDMLESEDWEETGFRWSNLLELLLENRQLGSSAQSNLVRGFRQAFDAWQPSLEKGTLWFYDCMALRFCSDAELGEECATLLMDCCEKLVGACPAEDRETYNELFNILSLAADALVVEVFEMEQDVLDSRILMGDRVIGADAPTIFGLITLFDYEGYDFISDQTGQDGSQSDFENFIEERYAWLKPANERRKELGRKIFETLNALNPRIGQWRLGQNQYEDSERYGMQRILDLPWFRLGLATLRDAPEITKTVRAYIPALYENTDDELLSSDIKRKSVIPLGQYFPRRRLFDYAHQNMPSPKEDGSPTDPAAPLEWKLPDDIMRILKERGEDWQASGAISYTGISERERDHA